LPWGLIALDFRFEEVLEGFCVGGEFSDSVGEFFDGHLVFVEEESGVRTVDGKEQVPVRKKEQVPEQKKEQVPVQWNITGTEDKRNIQGTQDKRNIQGTHNNKINRQENGIQGYLNSASLSI
jgi:hypothetical protein